MPQSNSSLKLREIPAQDIPQVLKAMKQFCRELKIPFEKNSRLKNLQMIREKPKNIIFRLAYIKEAPSTLVGYLVISLGFSFEFAGRDSFLDEIYIASEFRSQGWGNILLNQAFRLAKIQGANYLHIESEENAKLSHFYRKNGFQKRKFVLQSRKL